MSVRLTEDNGLIAIGITDCTTLCLPTHVFEAAKRGDESVDLCPGAVYHTETGPVEQPSKFARRVTSHLAGGGILVKKFTCVKMGNIVLAYVGQYHASQSKIRRVGRHLRIGYVENLCVPKNLRWNTCIQRSW